MEQSYKEKYEDILARLERAKNDNDVCDERYCCVIDEIIPELAESEDEKIRKEIVGFLDMFLGTHITPTATPKQLKGWIAWLENIPYTIDHEKREGFHLGYKACLERQGEQKPTKWTEEEEAVLDALIRRLEGEDVYVSPHLAVECLESLKDRVHPKPMCKFGDTELTQEELCEGLIRGMVNEHNRVTKEVLRTEYEKGRADAIAEMQKEWSDVDKDILFCIINDLKFLRDTISIDPKYAVNIIGMEREITWLESLRHQNRWKPSETDIMILEKVFNGKIDPKDFQETLSNVLEQLKKLNEKV